MALTKEQILTLTCLKEVEVKGVGPQKIFAIGTAIDDRGLDIKSYEDLQNFPNLEYFHAGMTYLETIDLSCLPKLKELDLSDCRMLKTVVLAKGCKPEIKYPVAYKGEQVKVVYK